MAWVQKLPRKKGVRWRAYWRDPAGKRQSKVFERKRDAERYGREQELARDAGTYLDPSRGKIPVREFVEEEVLNSPLLAEKTKATYGWLWGYFLGPPLGVMPIRAVTKAHIKNVMVSMEMSGVGEPTRASALRLARTIFEKAVDDDRIARNPTATVRAPKPVRRQPRFMTDVEVFRLVAAAAERYQAMILFMAYTGLRLGEAIALRVGDLDLMRRRVIVARSVSDVDGRAVEKGTKTGKVRAVVMPSFVRDVLVCHLQRFSEPGEPSARVFTAPKGGPVQHNNFRTRAFYPAVKRAEIEPRPKVHDLRHTSAALAIARGAGPKQIQEMLGHSSIQVTMDIYGHLFDVLHEDLADRHDEALAATPITSGDRRPGIDIVLSGSMGGLGRVGTHSRRQIGGLKPSPKFTLRREGQRWAAWLPAT